LQPHRIRTFKRSNDPAFAAKLEAIVGLYLDPPARVARHPADSAATPPAHSLVLAIDEKSHVWMAPGSQEKS
jgi:hypothetical protein